MSNKRYEIDIDPRTIPTAQQKGERICYSRGGAFIHHYEKSKVARGRKDLEQALLVAMERYGGVHFSKGEPVIVDVEFVYPLGSLPRKLSGCYKVTRPDIDNLLKGFFDACTKCGMWNDDSQVQIGSATKRYVLDKTEEPHIYLGFLE